MGIIKHLKKNIQLYLLFVVLVGVGYLVMRLVSKNLAPPPSMDSYVSNFPDVVGNLGGIKVRIPHNYIRKTPFQYEGHGLGCDKIVVDGQWVVIPPPEEIPDNGFFVDLFLPMFFGISLGRWNPTYSTPICSFGIDVRYPDMRSEDTWAMRKDAHDNWLKAYNPWLMIGVTSGKRYPELADTSKFKNFLQVAAYSTTKENNCIHDWSTCYSKLPEKLYDLEQWQQPKTTDPITGEKLDPMSDKYVSMQRDLYIHRDEHQSVDVMITCGSTNVPDGKASCSMEFTLEPIAFASISVLFQREWLPQWQDIQHKTRALILSFEVKE